MSESVCGVYSLEDPCLGAVCDLPINHCGDHHAEVTWPHHEWPISAEPSPTGLLMQRIWERQLLHVLGSGPTP
jgi:hypothetical protein